MTSPVESSATADGAAERLRIHEADLALLLAFQAWDDAGPPVRAASEPQGAPGPREAWPWHRLAPSWARNLSALSESATTAAQDRSAARQSLRRLHETSMRVDLKRVHPSWCVRALLEESPAVRRVVAASAPEPLRSAILSGLSLDAHDLAGDRAANPDVLSWAVALWTERLVGGDPTRSDDPPAIVILSHLSPRSGYALCRLAGRIKRLLIIPQPAQEWTGAPRRLREIEIRELLRETDASFLEQVSRDFQSKGLAKVPLRHRDARIGALTVARLLADCEPFRLRWALQHWPYPIAKLIRSLIPAPAERPAFVIQGETLVLKTAWSRLNLEGRVAWPWPGL